MSMMALITIQLNEPDDHCIITLSLSHLFEWTSFKLRVDVVIDAIALNHENTSNMY